MDEYLKEAIGIVKAQASVRNMTEGEITGMVQTVAKGIKGIVEGTQPTTPTFTEALGPKRAIRERSIICLECGKSFKIITKRHLAIHGMTTDEYKAKHGYPRATALICKSLARDRRKKINDMALWERTGRYQKAQAKAEKLTAKAKAKEKEKAQAKPKVETKTRKAKPKATEPGRITCLECGRTFKAITESHLATHGMTIEEYKQKYGYTTTAPSILAGHDQREDKTEA